MPVGRDDAEAMFGYRSREEVARYQTSLPTSIEEFTPKMIEGESAERNLVMEHEGAIIGDLYCHVTDAWAQTDVREQAQGVQAEIGWTLDPAFQGRGFAAEGVRALISLCFAARPEGLGLRRVYADLFAANEPSRRLCERMGMRLESHTIRDSLHRSGEWMDSMVFGLLAEERPTSGG